MRRPSGPRIRPFRVPGVPGLLTLARVLANPARVLVNPARVLVNLARVLVNSARVWSLERVWLLQRIESAESVRWSNQPRWSNRIRACRVRRVRKRGRMRRPSSHASAPFVSYAWKSISIGPRAKKITKPAATTHRSGLICLARPDRALMMTHETKPAPMPLAIE